MKTPIAILLCLSAATARTACGGGDESPRPVQYRITGLFSERREAALREAFAKVPGVKLVSLDVEDAEATLEYDPAKLFPDAKPEQHAERLDNLLRSASHHTFGVKPLGAVPREKRQRVEIRVAGLDCYACSLAAYEAVARVEGVEVAKASFRQGQVTAWIDPEKTDRSKLVEALKKIGVDVRSP